MFISVNQLYKGGEVRLDRVMNKSKRSVVLASGGGHVGSVILQYFTKDGNCYYKT